MNNSDGSMAINLLYSLDGVKFYAVPYEYKSSEEGIFSFEIPGGIYAKYIKFSLNNTRNIREVAAYGETAVGIGFADKKIKFIDSNVPFETQVYLKSGFGSASIYVDDREVYEFTEEPDEVYDVVIPAEKLKGLAGVRDMKIAATYGSQVIEDVYQVTLTQGKAEMEIVNLDFSQTKLSSLLKTHKVPGKGSFVLSSNLQSGAATNTLEDGKYKMELNANSTAGTYLLMNQIAHSDAASGGYLPLEKGVVTAKFDMYLSSESLSLTLEPRNKHVHTSGSASVIYPASGPTYHLFTGRKGLFEFTLEFDTVNNLLRLYSREIDEETSVRSSVLKLEKEMHFSSDGLGQIRFTFVNPSDEAAYWTLDNYTVDYREVVFADIEFYKASSDLFANVNVNAFTGEDIKVIAAVKKDNKLCSINFLTPGEGEMICTAEFDVPRDFFTNSAYTAELFVVSQGDIMNILTKEVYVK